MCKCPNCKKSIDNIRVKTETVMTAKNSREVKRLFLCPLCKRPVAKRWKEAKAMLVG